MIRESTTHAKLLRRLLLLAICHQLSLSLSSPEHSTKLAATVLVSAASEAKAEAKAGLQSQQVRQLVETPSSINLKSILDHQEALRAECAKYHVEKARQVKLIRQFDDANDQVQLPRPLPVKVPAVCLFIFSESVRPASKPDYVASRADAKLELVNWIYDLDDDLDGESGSDNITKRHANGAPLDASNLLSDYLFDTTNIDQPADEESERENELAPMFEQRERMHKQVDNMLEDEHFRQMVERNRAKMATYLSPVILIPGLLGSRLQARTDKQSGVNILCSKRSDWQDLWLSLRKLLPKMVDCWLDNVRLEFDPASGFTRPPPGVETRVPDFGSVESVRHLDLNKPKMTAYYSALIDRYTQLGYTVDKNLLAAPYDFRLAPQQLAGYFDDLKQLIERAMRDNSPGGKKVTLVCHSMGCTHLLIFLRQQTAAWRQSRIRKVIALSSPWAGAIKALKALVVGDSLELPLVSEKKMKRLARGYPSIAFLLPQAELYARTNKNRGSPGGPVLVKTPEREYRVEQLADLLRDLNLTKQLDWFEATSALIKPLEPLQDVRVDCIHSLNTPTPETLIFRTEASFPNGAYELVNGDGDGTVNLESLMVCHDWAKQLPDKVKHKIIKNTNHVGVLSHKTTLTHITDDVLID